jgi:hypothetical protein
LKLRDAKILFDKLRRDAWRIVQTFHVLHDHSARKFTGDVIIALLQGRGHLADNKRLSAASDSFMWFCKDEADRPCELVVKFEPLNGNPSELVLVISAYREVKK